MSPRFEQILSERIAATDSRLCVGLDPRPERIEGSVESFLFKVVDEVAPLAAALKPNLAYFEAMGVEGYQLLDRVLGHIPKELPVILDGKRNDIPETQKYYARAYFERWSVTAVTLNPYMGFDSIEPFLDYPGKGLYLLSITSNPGAHDLQLLDLGAERVFNRVSAMAEKARGRPASVGLVVGLTHLSPEMLAALPDVPLLLPGLGAQGGDLKSLSHSERTAPLLINSSRSILYGDGDQESFGDRARRAREKINHVLN